MKRMSMMQGILCLKCPFCSTILKVRNTPGIEEKNVTCPVCKRNSRFMDFKVIVLDETDDETDLGDRTDINIHKNDEIGKLKVLDTGYEHSLQIGINTIGRKAKSSKADIQIVTSDMKMSRLHAAIEVVKRNDGDYSYYFFNMKNMNKTYINEQLVGKEDRYILRGGEIIKLAHTVIKFTMD